MKNISLKKIQKTIKQNRMQLMEIEKEIRKNCQIQNEIDKREKEIEKSKTLKPLENFKRFFFGFLKTEKKTR